MKRVAILQSNYIPWKGYFDLINSVDEFVFYDIVQYTTRDWRNRNKIKTANGLKWLSVSVKNEPSFSQKINEVQLHETFSLLDHWRKIEEAYKKAPYFKEISQWLKPIYTESKYTLLSELNKDLIKSICSYLNITTKLSCSSQLTLPDDRSEKLLSICSQLNAGVYISGPAAKQYLNIETFTKNEIDVEWFSYDGYPEYPQLNGDFEHNVSILDLLFNCGKHSYKSICKTAP